MKLSEIVNKNSGFLVRDGDFFSMNYCTAKVEKPFLSFMEKEKFIPKMNKNVSCIICTSELANQIPETVSGIFVSEEPKYLFHQIYHEMGLRIEKKKFDTQIGSNCDISPLAYVSPENVTIGNHVIIEPFAYIGKNVKIKDNCIIHANAVIGGKSFSFARSNAGDMCGLDDNGHVLLEENVEIFSFTHIAQGIWEDDVTVIGKSTRIDAQCHIGHGAQIGKSVLIAANAVIGGNTCIGDDTWIGINATLSNRIKIGDSARVSLGAVVTKDVPDGMTVSGNFAIDHSRFIQFVKNDMLGNNE